MPSPIPETGTPDSSGGCTERPDRNQKELRTSIDFATHHLNLLSIMLRFRTRRAAPVRTGWQHSRAGLHTGEPGHNAQHMPLEQPRMPKERRPDWRGQRRAGAGGRPQTRHIRPDQRAQRWQYSVSLTGRQSINLRVG